MNRAERRAHRKPNRQHYGSGCRMLHKLYCHSNQAMDADDVQKLMQPIYAALVRLSAGAMTVEDVALLGEQNLFGFDLAHRIYKGGDEVTQAQIAPAEDVFKAAADILEAIYLRAEKTGKYGASGDQLCGLRDMAMWVDQLCKVATHGLVLQALESAKVQVENMWMQKGVER